MKVYKRYDKYNFAFPDDMEKILNYLYKHGEILVNDSTIESLYFDFSYEKYDAGWMGVNEQILEEFEDWLEHFDRPIYLY